jgi:NAD(P)-dependent dehydrogenase (short-subunit alcohol dehydrogenase family)
MAGKICLVTGSTDGIGLETAKTLALWGARVIIHGRNAQKGQRALDAIKQLSPVEPVEFVQADFSSLDAVRSMAKQINAMVPHIDVLINNAGASATAKLSQSPDGHELTFAVNHLAPFLLTHLLLDKLKAAPRARIVNVSSLGHTMAPFDINDLMTENAKPLHAYFRAKFANILFSNELARRLEPFGIVSNALHPGTIKSNFGHESLQTALFYKLARPFLKTVKQGATTLIYLASSPEVEGKTGGYYFNCKLKEPAKETNSIELAQQLWQKSEALVALVALVAL